MKKLLLFASLVFLFTFYCSEKSTDEWIDITPGTDLEGWTRISIPPDQPLNEVEQWSADPETKTVRCNGTGGHEWLRYDGEEFGDCIFHVEFKYDKLENDAKYNSGFYVRNNADGTIWHQGQIGGGTGGFLFGVSPVNGENSYTNTSDQLTSSPVKPAGEWNTAEIRCEGSTLSMIVNDVPTVVWENLQVEKGYVGLEAEGYAIDFRNLKVKKLDDAK